MPGQQGDVVTQRPDAPANGIQQCLVVTTGKISAADGALKDHVADNGYAILLVHKDHMPGGVSRAMAYLQDLITELDLVTFLQPAVRHERLAGGKAYLGTPLWQGVEQEPVVLMRSFDRQAQLPRHATNRAGMIEMAMGNENLLQCGIGIVHHLENPFGVTTGIDQHRPAAGFAARQGTVLLVCRDRNDRDIHKGKRTAADSRRAK